AFHGIISGAVYAQPLYVENGPGGHGAIYQVTETNDVYALDETSGDALWHVNLGASADMTAVGCGGGVHPLGVTGTPSLDLAARTIYLDAVKGASPKGIDTHLVHALSIDDGSERSGWPVDVKGLASNGHVFDPLVENQRGALALVGGTLFVPYGGHPGDCGAFHGWIVAIPVADPTKKHAWAPPADAAAIWAPSGISSDGTSIFAATGNSTKATTWGAGEAMLRLSLDLTFSGLPRDYFAPSNWAALDATDTDLGGSGALLVDVPGATPSKLAVALGKDGMAYVADRQKMGGVPDAGPGGVVAAPVMNRDIITPAAPSATGAGAV